MFKKHTQDNVRILYQPNIGLSKEQIKSTFSQFGTILKDDQVKDQMVYAAPKDSDPSNEAISILHIAPNKKTYFFSEHYKRIYPMETIDRSKRAEEEYIAAMQCY